MLFLLWLVTIVIALVLYYRQVYSRFRRCGVKYFRPIPILGNLARTVFGLEHMADDLDRYYNNFPDEKFVGRFEFLKPMLVMRDLELIKKITVKDFEYFLDHRTMVDEDTEPFFGRNLFSMKGQEWKDMRSTLSPAFTSSKMRLMVPFMVEVGEQMLLAVRAKILDSKEQYIDIDSKEMTTRFANDVIASCAFGIKVNSHKDENNEFYHQGKNAAQFKFLQFVKFLAINSFPKIMKTLKITFFSAKTSSFFENIIRNTMLHREKNNIIRPDMIHLLMEAKKGKLSHDSAISQDANAGFATVEESSIGKNIVDRAWSETDIIAQAAIFFIAGFEGVSTIMSFALHELALNPDVQEKLIEEIRENNNQNGSKFDYNSVQDMKYLDMVVSEVLRLWTPAVAFDRVCVKDYNLGRPNDKATEDYIIRKGEGLIIPAWAFHRNPNYFQNPLKFDPERFSDENKHNIIPFTYVPFGLGPRNCIGSRFALCELKVMLYQILQDIEVVPCKKTPVPAKLANGTFNVQIKGGHWVRLKIRQN
ncbi:cytochrome P450 9e2-like [Achroia grisella]|uniref:cytochrome P450 9e2-like n=1 Tax=Achroia grisella TaxID=688607 RepID=UPI0027D2BE3E|nr:cytochrome P450 9e2-like [Achroia grisella]